MTRLLLMQIARDEDVVTARQRARQVADAVGFDLQDQTRIATAVSELARNVTSYAGAGTIEFALDLVAHTLTVTVTDAGPGIPHLDSVLDGSYRSETGAGLGITGARRIMDEFEIESTPDRGTVVRMLKRIPRRRLVPATQDMEHLAEELAREQTRSVLDEVQTQNHELLAALDELRARQDDLARLNAELQDTNRGVVALYAELDEKAEHLRRADETKSRFLSNMTHEFQTPLNSILALTRILLDRTDGELTSEQDKQVRFIRQASEELSELVHDLLDLAKVEAGKVTLRAAPFLVQELFGALRGLMRPVQTNDAVTLVFDAAEQLPPLYTDEGKISQILRNYISNALKFTERGEVRVTAALDGEETLLFAVTDTGIGIAAADQGRLFHEFGQIPNRLQAKVRGTGLGLSLSKRLAELLGGSVGVASVPGEGSTFWLRVPLTAPGVEPPRGKETPPPAPEPAGNQAPLALVIDDEQAARYLLRRYLLTIGCRVVEASGGTEGLARAESARPDVIFLDLRMPDMLGTEVLARLKRNPGTARIPVIIATSHSVADDERQRLTAQATALVGKAILAGVQAEDEIRRALRSAKLNL